ncbi:MAG: hypothetical protein WBL05_01415 [Brooklawnia sp.]|uniref:hypothetical protein n=1 Tax=Brooklawnia sp. TaxID=2699740 RepID=UPI003C78ECCF
MVKIIWATGGRSWGFRFLLDGGYPDPLPTYERAFAGLESEVETCRRVGDLVALRFPDPEGREDIAGRVIPHDFVVMAPLSWEINSVPDGRDKVWNLVKGIYEQVWSSKRPPSARAVQAAIDGTDAIP